MPWRHVDAKAERSQFVRDARERLVTFTEPCALRGIDGHDGMTDVFATGFVMCDDAPVRAGLGGIAPT